MLSYKPSLVAPLPDQPVSEHQPVPLLLNTPPSFDDHLLRPDTTSRLLWLGFTPLPTRWTSLRVFRERPSLERALGLLQLSQHTEGLGPAPKANRHLEKVKQGQEKQLYHHKNTFQKQSGLFPLQKRKICKKDTLNTMPVQSGYFSMGVFVFSHIFHEHEDKNNITTITYL